MGAHYRLYKSSDGGVKWHPMINLMMLSMALDPRHPSTLYAVSSKRGLLKTTDGGAHWKPSQAGIPAGQVTGVALDRVNGTVFAYGVGIYRSTDGGSHWTPVLPKKTFSNVAIGAGHTAYAASQVDGLYVSHDGGVRWKHVGSIGNQPVIQVGAAGQVAYAAAAIGLFKSVDGGHRWKLLTGAPPGIQFVGISPTDPNEVFGEFGAHSFVVSYDGGASWHSANSGIRDKNFTASTIQVAPSSPQIVYTGSWGLSFYASHDGGRHWVRTARLTH
jgi:photosystem II stability/assembly factor-like uncharacterized protein